MLRTASKVSGVALVGGTGVFAYKYNTDDGVRRVVQFWKEVFPIYLHYRYYQILNRDLKVMNDVDADAKYLELHEKYSYRVRNLTYGMKGFYLKQAQLMSTQDDFVPKKYMEWVKNTQDNVPTVFDGEDAQRYCAKLLKEELNLEFDDVFSSWDHEPLGVASIGQVHKAVLRETGQTVAVKILAPGIEAKFRVDIATLKRFCQLAMPQHVPAFAEIERQFTSGLLPLLHILQSLPYKTFVIEFDYRREAENLNQIHSFMLPKWKNVVDLPRPHLALCSKNLLVMDYLNGVKLVDGIRQRFRKLAALSGRTVEEIEKERFEAMKAGKLSLLNLDQAQAERKHLERMLWYGDMLNPNNLWKICYNFSIFRLVYGPAEYEWTELPVDLASTFNVLSQVHANQVFEHGCFNGDPHPGNILLLQDGRLGLIDYGQVKRMSIPQRISYAKLIIAHSRGDIKEIVRLHFDELGVKTKYRNEDVAYLMSSFYNDRDSEDVLGKRNIPSFLDYCQSQDPMISMPDDFIIVSRMNILLRGMGKAFGLKLRMSQLWADEARRFLESQGVQY